MSQTKCDESQLSDAQRLRESNVQSLPQVAEVRASVLMKKITVLQNQSDKYFLGNLREYCSEGRQYSPILAEGCFKLLFFLC